jgi:hypothetical protein
MPSRLSSERIADKKKKNPKTFAENLEFSSQLPPTAGDDWPVHGLPHN